MLENHRLLWKNAGGDMSPKHKLKQEALPRQICTRSRLIAAIVDIDHLKPRYRYREANAKRATTKTKVPRAALRGCKH
jgi:hypothetical protein